MPSKFADGKGRKRSWETESSQRVTVVGVLVLREERAFARIRVMGFSRRKDRI